MKLNYPKNIFIEPTNTCNLKCDMCPHSESLVKNLGFISIDLIDKIIKDLEAFDFEIKPKINLHITGEPFMHKKLLQIISLFSKNGYTTSLHTNGILIEDVKDVIDSGLDEITFSFECYDKNIYKMFRNNNHFEYIDNIINDFLFYPNEIQVIIEPLFFRHLHKGLHIDEFIKNKYYNASFNCYFASDFRGTLSHKKYLTEPIEHSQKVGVCKNPIEDLAISWDGEIKACTLDYNSENSFGNIRNKSIYEIWFSDTRKLFLKNIFNLCYENNKICKNCKAPYFIDNKERLLF